MLLLKHNECIVLLNDFFSLQFTECEELDYHFESVHDSRDSEGIEKLLKKATDYTQRWLNFLKKEDFTSTGVGTTLNQSQLEGSSLATRSSFWSSLIQDGVKYKALIALLFYYMDSGQKLEASSAMRSYCLKSASLYFILLGIPGSGAFKIFHPVLYNKALDTFKLALKLHLVKQSPKKKPNKKSQQPKKRAISRAGSIDGFSEGDWLDDSDDEGLS